MGVFLMEGPSALAEDANTSLLIIWLTAPLAAAFAGGMFGVLGMYFFWACIFPIIQLVASVGFMSKRHLDRMRHAELQNTTAEQQVKSFDKLFSIQGFYSNIQNKLAAIHFAETQGEIKNCGASLSLLEGKQ